MLLMIKERYRVTSDQKVPAGTYRISLQAPQYLSFVDTQSTKTRYLMLVQPTWEQNSRGEAAPDLSALWRQQLSLPGLDAGPG